MDLKHIIDRGRYSGVLAVSDVHAEFHLVTAAVKYATEHNFFVVFLGDYIDGGKRPHETIAFVRESLDTGRAVAIIGNHEDKFYRYAAGNPVHLGKDQLATLDYVSDVDAFLADVRAIVEHDRAKHYFRFGDTTFLHAAAHHSVWDAPETLTGKAKAMALYGEVDGTRDEVGFPVRTYGWVDKIPAGRTAVVGHDRTAMGKATTEAVTRTGVAGGTVLFTDTSAGKSSVVGGHVTGAVFKFTDDALTFTSFVPFH